MSAIEFTTALDGARTLAFIDGIARDLWRAYGAGEIGESDAESIAARIEEARRRIKPQDTVRARASAVPLASVSMFPARKRRRVSPDRAASRARRRRLAYSGPLPPALAAGFTVGQLAALRIVADEVRAHGVCTLALEAIAAKAGICVTTARGAIRLAAGDGLAITAERRRHGRPSLTNVVRIVSREWLAWIRRGAGGGCRNANPKDNKILSPPSGGAAAKGNSEKRGRGEGGAKSHGQSGSIGLTVAKKAAAASVAMASG
jgi:hypothetical protein